MPHSTLEVPAPVGRGSDTMSRGTMHAAAPIFRAPAPNPPAHESTTHRIGGFSWYETLIVIAVMAAGSALGIAVILFFR